MIKTVIDLLEDQDYREDLFPVGRLDKDTEGLLILTNDAGCLPISYYHHLKNMWEKEYLVEVSGIMTEEDIRLFAEGLIIDGDEQTLPAKLQIDQVDQETETSIIRLICMKESFTKLSEWSKQ